MAHKAFGSSTGLTILAEDQATPANGMVAYVTSSWNSGYQNGDIKGAFLSDTDDTDLVGSGELVTNGDFSSGFNGWNANEAAWSVSDGAARHEPSDDARYDLRNSVFYPTGVPKILTFDYENVSGSGFIVEPLFENSTLGQGRFNFTAPSGVGKIILDPGVNRLSIFRKFDSGVQNVFEIDNVSVKLADEDRSVNNNGLIVNGTVTREPVAPGADLVAYSGFSSSNYLEQPYNPDLDFGTGGFCIMGWFKEDALDSLAYLFARDTPGTTAANFMMYLQSGQLTFKIDDDTTQVLNQVGGASVAGAWRFVTGVKRGNSSEVYVDGRLENEEDISGVGSLDNGSAVLRVGISQNDTSPFDGAGTGGSLALWRISATAPTAEQIAKIYEDEKFLFQENAQATLYGTSDAVTALAHDPVTDLLHVGTSDGRSVFQGLRRVDNTTDAVSTAISASNNLIVEQ
jgi:hypothetical protein